MTSFKPKHQIGVGGLHLGKRERQYLNEVIASNQLSYGPMTERFEREFARLHDCRYAAFCNSGTSALHIALAALKELHRWDDGDEVIVPATTFVATANIVVHNRMVPVFVDVDPRTYNMDPALLEAKISPRTRAIIPAHMFGLPCDMDDITAIARTHRLRIIEDSCETMFATYRGRKVGSMGDIGCFSTYVAHLIVTGVGGLATTNDPKLAIILRSLMNHGRDAIYLRSSDDQGIGRNRLFEIAARRFSFVRFGHSFRCTELEAAVGLGQLECHDHILRAHKENAEYFTARLKPIEKHVQLPYIPEDRDHVFMLYPLVLRNQPKRALVNYLEERLIETRDLMPLVNQPIYKKLFGNHLEDQFEVAKKLNRCGFYMGCHQHLGKKEREYMADTLLAFFKRVHR